MSKYLTVFLTVLTLLLPAQAFAQERVGTVVEIEGTASIARQGGTPNALELNAPVQTGDVLLTGPKSRLFVLLADNTEWTLAENSNFRVDEYVFDPEQTSGNKARYSVLQGGFRYVSGLFGQKENPNLSISSPAGTIGIRGTDITVASDIDGSYDVYVDDGIIEVASGSSSARLQRGQGTTILRRGAAPIAPTQWKRERLNRLRGQLVLARETDVRMRIRQLQPHQVKLRQELRDSVKKKHGQGNEEGLKPPQKELKLNNPQLNERQQQFEKRRAETQKHRSIGEKPAEGSNKAPGANTPTDKTPKRTLAPQLPRQRRNAN